jgi:hypothetical protein
MTEKIIVALITVAIPSITTIITSLIAKKDNYMHNAKQSILQLIVEDKIRVIEGGIPENKQNILKEFDIYSKKGGNSYVHEKVENYIKWYNIVTKKVEKLNN